MIRHKVACDRKTLVGEGKMTRQMTKASNIEGVTVGKGEWDFREGVGLKEGEKLGKFRELNQDAGTPGVSDESGGCRR